MTTLPGWMNATAPVNGSRVIFNPNGCTPPLVSVATRSTGAVSLGKQTDAPRFTPVRPGVRAQLGWVDGYEAKACADIVSGAHAGYLAVIVFRPYHFERYAVITTAYTTRAQLGSTLSDNRRIGTYATWDDAMRTVLELSRR